MANLTMARSFEFPTATQAFRKAPNVELLDDSLRQRKQCGVLNKTTMSTFLLVVVGGV